MILFFYNLAYIRDPSTNQAQPINKLRLKLEYLDEIRTRLDPSKVELELFRSVSYYNRSLVVDDNLSKETPWFDAWKQKFLNNLEYYDTDFIGAYFGAIFIMTENDLPNFKEIIANLSAQLKAIPNVKWFSPNFLKYFLVVSENELTISNPNEDKDKDDPFSLNFLFNDLVSFYDSNRCTWFQIDKKFITSITNHDTNNQELKEEPSYSYESDPLNVINSSSSSSSTFEIKLSESVKLSNKEVSEKSQFELKISEELLKRCENFLRDLMVRALIPWADKHIRLFSESIALKKGIKRSIFSATKQFFVMSSSANSLKGSNQMIYVLEGVEMERRKLADLAMCFDLYELAYNNYYSAKKEFQADGAGSYYASACEAAALSSYLIDKFQRQYFDQAISQYLEVSKSYHLATRATLIATDIIRDMWPNEASSLFIRLTSEDSETRSALFLEQAAKCFEKAFPIRKRKAAFHYVLAGHRYNRNGLKKLALACYMLYSSPHWTYAIDHVNFTKSKLLKYCIMFHPEVSLLDVYLIKTIELLRLNSSKEIFFKELAKLFSGKESAAITDLITANSEKLLYTNEQYPDNHFQIRKPVKTPTVKSLVVEEIEGSSLIKSRSTCFYQEEIIIRATLWSSFGLTMNEMAIFCNTSQVDCSPLDVDLNPGEEKTLRFKVTPQKTGDFDLIGLVYRYSEAEFFYEFSQKQRKSLLFTCIQSLPPLDLTINIPNHKDTDAVKLLTGQLIDFEIRISFKSLVDCKPCKAVLSTQANLVGIQDTLINPIEIKFNSTNLFKIQASFVAGTHSINFQVTCIEMDSLTPIKRSFTKTIDFYVRECLVLENRVNNVISLRNVLSSTPILVSAHEDEKLDLMPGLTAHLLVNGDMIHWKTEKCTGLIDVST